MRFSKKSLIAEYSQDYFFLNSVTAVLVTCCVTLQICVDSQMEKLSVCTFLMLFSPSLEKSVTVEPILFKNIKHLSFPEYVDVNAIWIVVVRTHILTVKRETGWKQNKSTFNEADKNFQKKQKTLKFSRVDQKSPNKAGYQARNHRHKKYERVWKYRQTGN